MNLSGFRRLAGQSITMTGSSQKSNAAPAGTRRVFLATQAQPAWFLIGPEPVAAAGALMLPANQQIVLDCTPGERVAVLQAGTGGVFAINFLG